MYYLKVTDYEQQYNERYQYHYSVPVNVRWVAFENAVMLIRHLDGGRSSYYSLTPINWKLIDYKGDIRDGDMCPVTMDVVRREYEQAPTPIIKGRYTNRGFKHNWHRSHNPKYKHKLIAKVIGIETDTIDPWNDESRHRPRVYNHRTWKRFRRTQWK